MQIKKTEWSHFDERPLSCQIKHLVVHCFAYPIADIIPLWQKMKVGPHYLIDTDGSITQFVAEEKAARHAGKSLWRGDTSLNASSIGIELYNPSFGQETYSESQLDSFKNLAHDIVERYAISAENIVGHSDIAPERKVDPGTAFPWAEMAKEGLGIWPTTLSNSVADGDAKTLLARIGYDVTNEKAAFLAFMRHFMPNRIAKEEDIFQMEELLPLRINENHTADKEILEWLKSVADAYK